MIQLQNTLSPAQVEAARDPFAAVVLLLSVIADPRAAAARLEALKAAQDQAEKSSMDARAATATLQEERAAFKAEMEAARKKQAGELAAERRTFDAEIKAGRDTIAYQKQQAATALEQASASRDSAKVLEEDLNRRLQLLRDAAA